MPKLTSEYESRMLDVLEVYEREYDPKQPVVCRDEKNFQLRRAVRADQPTKPDRPKRVDFEYERAGTAKAFVAVEPLGQNRHVRVTKRHTKADFAAFLRFMVLDKYAQVERIV